MTTDQADHASHSAGAAPRDGQIERAAHLMATDPDRAGLWKSATSRVITRAGQSGLRREVALRLLAAGIDANDSGLLQAVRHNQALGIGVPERRPTWTAT
jgi:hypothetical protein